MTAIACDADRARRPAPSTDPPSGLPAEPRRCLRTTATASP